MDKKELIKWIKRSFESETRENLCITLASTSGKTDGYLGHIIFAEVKYRDKSNGEEKVLCLAVKYAPADLRQTIPFISKLFQREIEVYTKIFPAMYTFQLEQKTDKKFHNYPKCFNTIVSDGMDGIIFENLTSNGYTLHDRKLPFSTNQVKFVLEIYANIHATSLAFSDQRNDEFKKITFELQNFVKDRFSGLDCFTRVAQVLFDSTLDILKNRGKFELHEKLENYLKTDLTQEVLNLLECDTGISVISHVDAWNNNYLFQYGTKNGTTLNDVKIIDWQMTDILNSPVYDISHFLYNCVATEDLNNLRHLLEHYHGCLSQYLSNLGSDANKLFPFHLLIEHWKKFNVFGFVHFPVVLKQCYWNPEDLPVISSNDEWPEVARSVIIKDELYYERLLGVLDHHFNYKF